MSESTSTGIPRIGDPAPDFKALTTQGEIQFSDWQKGSWVVLFSHPADFTPVCSTELVEFARRNDEFAQRNTKLIGLSVDSIHSHLAWRENLRQIMDVDIPYPLIADLSTEVAQKYGMIHPGAATTATVRTVFFIDDKGIVRAMIYYPMSCGRNVDEILRVLDALQTADANGVATPANWRPGEPVVVPAPLTKDAAEKRMGEEGLDKFDWYLSKKPLPK